MLQISIPPDFSARWICRRHARTLSSSGKRKSIFIASAASNLLSYFNLVASPCSSFTDNLSRLALALAA
jgi:hypothetical protein